jgi:hypothetical protein
MLIPGKLQSQNVQDNSLQEYRMGETLSSFADADYNIARAQKRNTYKRRTYKCIALLNSQWRC